MTVLIVIARREFLKLEESKKKFPAILFCKIQKTVKIPLQNHC